MASKLETINLINNNEKMLNIKSHNYLFNLIKFQNIINSL